MASDEPPAGFWTDFSVTELSADSLTESVDDDDEYKAIGKSSSFKGKSSALDHKEDKSEVRSPAVKAWANGRPDIDPSEPFDWLAIETNTLGVVLTTSFDDLVNTLCWQVTIKHIKKIFCEKKIDQQLDWIINLD